LNTCRIIAEGDRSARYDLIGFVNDEIFRRRWVGQIPSDQLIRRDDAIWLLLSAAAKFTDFDDGKVEGSRLDNKIQSPRFPRLAPIDEG
jgi:hypothetical protein